MPIVIIKDNASHQQAQQWRHHSVSTNKFMFGLMVLVSIAYVIGLVNLTPFYIVLFMIFSIKITCALQIKRYKDKEASE